MPIYELECYYCHHFQEIIIGIAELVGKDSNDMDLSELNIKCEKCGKSRFHKRISAHGKTAHNWSAWQR
jgi:hypothetical protein